MKAQAKWLENTRNFPSEKQDRKKGTGYFFLKKLPVPFFVPFLHAMIRCPKSRPGPL
jgi:hypothetical protein